MEVETILLADAASFENGVLRVVRPSRTVKLGKAPQTRSFALICEFSGGAADFGTVRNLTIELIDDDGEPYGEVGMRLEIPRGRPGERVYVWEIIELPRVHLTRQRAFALRVWDGERQIGEAPINVRQSPLPAR